MSRPVVFRRAERVALQCLVLAALAVAASPAPASFPSPRPAPPSPASRAAADAGAWIALTPPALVGHAAICDPDADHVLVFGGNSAGSSMPTNDTWMLALAGTPEWFRVPVDASLVPPRSYATAIHDPVGRRMIVFGGDLGGGYYPTSNTYALSLVPPCAWTVLAPGGDPGARMQQAAVYDPVRRRMIVFGGTNGYSLFNDAWTLSLGGSPQWDPMSPAGTPPAGRYFASATYDPVRDRVIVIGGVATGGVVLGDVWALNLAGGGTWTQLTPGGAAFGEHYGHVSVYDPSGDRVIVFGGVSLTAFRDDAWALSLAGSPSWTRLTPAGDPAPPVAFHAGAYDSRRDRLVTHGGSGADGYATCGVWTLSLGASPAWTHMTSPVDLSGHSMTADPERDRAIVFGGMQAATPTNAAWGLGLAGPATWTSLAPAGTPPAARANHSAILDGARDRLVVFGGESGPFEVFGDLWTLSLDGSPAWTALAPSGTPPAARASHTAILDPVRQRMIVFGGRTLAGARQDVCAFALSGAPAWSVLSPTGTRPASRWNHAAIYDPLGDRMIVHGGENTGGWLDDTWAMSLSGTPAWTQLAPGGELPYARTGHHALYDPLIPRMIVTGGLGTPTCDVWALALSGSLAWAPLLPDGLPMSGRQHHEAVVDADHDRILLFGGLGGGGDLWAIARGFGAVGSPPAPAVASFAAAWMPNPARGAAWLALQLPAAARIELRLFDVTGRQVRVMRVGRHEAGPHRIAWDGRDDAGRPLPPGLYFGEVRADDRVARARLAITR